MKESQIPVPFFLALRSNLYFTEYKRIVFQPHLKFSNHIPVKFIGHLGVINFGVINLCFIPIYMAFLVISTHIL